MSKKDPHALIGHVVEGHVVSTTAHARQERPLSLRLHSFAGAGKFAWVFEAYPLDGDPSGRVAVKLLYRGDSQALRRFQREIKVMQQLPAHPNSIAYRGHGTFNSQPWVAMDFIDGFNLGRVFKSKNPIPEQTAINLMAQLCDGFEGLHRLGLTHRDITPANVMVTHQERQVKIMDFGLVQDSQGLLQLYEQADILEGEDFLDDLDAGLIAGTPEYMAPEQILDPREKDRMRQKTDTTADVFALGTIFYQLLTGRQLFPHTLGAKGAKGKEALINYLQWRVSLTDDDIIQPPEIGDALWSIVRKSLSRDPSARQADAMEFGADLRLYLETGLGVVEDDLSATIAAIPDAEFLAKLATLQEAAAPIFDVPDDGDRTRISTPAFHFDPTPAQPEETQSFGDPRQAEIRKPPPPRPQRQAPRQGTHPVIFVLWALLALGLGAGLAILISQL